MSNRTTIDIDLRGRQAVDNALGLTLRQTHQVMRRVMQRAGVEMRSATVASFGQPGIPKRRTGALSRGVRNFVEERGISLALYFGVSASVPYGRILELGGWQPGRIIEAKRARALRWYSGIRQRVYKAELKKGATYKQAARAARHAYRGRKDRFSDVVFVKRVHQAGRWQKAMPYLTPPFMRITKGMPDEIRDAIVAEGIARRGKGTP